MILGIFEKGLLSLLKALTVLKTLGITHILGMADGYIDALFSSMKKNESLPLLENDLLTVK